VRRRAGEMSTRPDVPIGQHNVEIERNLRSWNSKPVLRRAYREFHERIAAHLDPRLDGKIVELGSGIGNIRDVIPTCIRTDLFPNPWIDRIESAYSLSFKDGECSHLILFDVFHHLRHPRTALDECRRVLQPRGRIILFEPYISLAGRLVYGPLHHEPIGFDESIAPDAPASFSPAGDGYYAAQGNATRVFWNGEHPEMLDGWDVVSRERISAWSYALTGGYSKPQLYPAALYGVISSIDKALELVPRLSALRTLIVLRKREQ
jgi:SAM-dependent methyltransferase